MQEIPVILWGNFCNTFGEAGNFNFEVECINLIQVNFYIDPANTSIDNSDCELISLQDKEEIIKISLEQE